MDEDFERRRELRRQKREEMRLEAERLSYRNIEDDEEEAARERRRRARQERLRNKDFEEPVTAVTDSTELNSNSMAEAETTGSSVSSAAASEEDQALQERLAKREERRQRRLQEAMARQKELDPTATDSIEGSREERHCDAEEEQEPNDKAPKNNTWHEEETKEASEEDQREEEEAEPEEPEEEVEEEMQEEVEKPRRSYLREEEVVGEETRQSFKKEEEVAEEKPRRSFRREEVTKDEEVTPQPKQHNGAFHDNTTAKHKKPERTSSRGNLRSPEAEDSEDAARLEAERKLEELKRRRDDAESEEFERMRQKQQEAEAELEELKRRREERKKVLEEEERQRKQEMEEKKAKEEEEKRKMKEEIERRRAEAAEKRHKVEESADGEDKKLFKCVSPRGSSLKIEERAEFLNKSAQKSTVKTSHVPVVSKIDNRLEQYTTALQSNREAKSPRSAAVDLPTVTDGIRNIKSMWEKGNVFGSTGSAASINKEAAVIKVGVAGRINDWLNKTPDSGKPTGGRPVDLKPGDVTNKRSLWENKSSSPAKPSLS